MADLVLQLMRLDEEHLSERRDMESRFAAQRSALETRHAREKEETLGMIVDQLERTATGDSAESLLGPIRLAVGDGALDLFVGNAIDFW